MSSRPSTFSLASDFDQTLSFNDSGLVLSELIGASRFEEKVAGLARSNLVQQGGELAYLIRHDPEFRGVRREHLDEAGRRVRLRSNIPRARRLPRARRRGLPVLVLRDLGGAAGSGPVGPRRHRRARSHLRHRARVRRRLRRGAVDRPRPGRLRQGRGGRRARGAARRRRRTAPSTSATAAPTCTSCCTSTTAAGFTIAVSENRQLARIAQEHGAQRQRVQRRWCRFSSSVVGWGSSEIRALFESYGLTLHEWEKARTDRVTRA